MNAVSSPGSGLKTDLVVAGPHGRTGLRRLILGSVAEEDQELVRYFVGQSAEVLNHGDEDTQLVLNMVAMNNRYIHVPNEYISAYS